MASAITHFIVGAAIALPAMQSRALLHVMPRPAMPRPFMPRWALPVTAGLWAAAPDLDTWLMLGFGIPRSSIFSHRGFFHSPFFLILCAALLAAAVAGKHGRRTVAWLALMWAVSAVTHPLLDMLTDGGSGVMLLFPFSIGRFFFPWRPIRVSPLSIARFFDRAGPILWSELPFCAAALAVGILGLQLAKRRRCHAASEP
ncbi:MAG TPA: metal-dependent hydrolase [Candidatus Acidoferrales bacterium]|nr:metal-dependent hydrolase [Candidatus Acidoferrales bacterium]